MSNEIIDFDSSEAATLKTVTGWVSSSGGFWGDDERMARWQGCTHVSCSECGTQIAKSRSICESCWIAQQIRNYYLLDEVDPEHRFIYCQNDEEFYTDLTTFKDMCDEPNEDKRLVVCVPYYAPELDIYDYLEDYLADDQEPPDALIEAANVFNAAVNAYRQPITWFPGTARVKASLFGGKNV